MEKLIIPAFGPNYPNLGTGITKYRRAALAAGGSMAMDRFMRQAYGEAVGEAIRALQKRELAREVSPPSSNCASRTFHNDGASIEKAIRAQHRAQANTAAARDRNKTPKQWRDLYEIAMKAKRK